MSNEVVISCPVVGSTTLAVIAEVALMEATVHLLDLLVAVPDPMAAIEVLAGRADPAVACRRSGDDRHTSHSKLTATDGIKLALLT